MRRAWSRTGPGSPAGGWRPTRPRSAARRRSGGIALLAALVVTPLVPGVDNPPLLRYRQLERRLRRRRVRRLHEREPTRGSPGPPAGGHQHRAVPRAVVPAPVMAPRGARPLQRHDLEPDQRGPGRRDAVPEPGPARHRPPALHDLVPVGPLAAGRLPAGQHHRDRRQGDPRVADPGGPEPGDRARLPGAVTRRAAPHTGPRSPRPRPGGCPPASATRSRCRRDSSRRTRESMHRDHPQRGDAVGPRGRAPRLLHRRRLHLRPRPDAWATGPTPSTRSCAPAAASASSSPRRSRPSDARPASRPASSSASRPGPTTSPTTSTSCTAATPTRGSRSTSPASAGGPSTRPRPVRSPVRRTSPRSRARRAPPPPRRRPRPRTRPRRAPDGPRPVPHASGSPIR